MPRQNLSQGWSLRSIGSLGRVVSGATPSTRVAEFWDGDLAWITPADLSEQKTPFISSTQRRITRKGLGSCAVELVPKRNLVISSRAPIGYVAVSLMDFATNQGCKSLWLHDQQDCMFHYYNLLFHVQKLKEKGEGTTFAEISKSTLSTVELSVPDSQRVQYMIGRVLGTVDRAIEQTEALIAKYQRIKTGLMQDLLTRGIDEHGRLRDRATHKFKPSPLGQIPAEWSVRLLGECVKEQITYGIVQAGPHIPGGVPYIRTGDMDGDELVRDQLLCTSRVIADRHRRSEVKAGEIVCAIRATVGKVLPVPDNLDGANLTQGTARISQRGDIHGRFLLWAIRSERTQEEISLQSKGTTFAEITLMNLRRTHVAMPKSVEEQEQVARILDAADGVIARETTSLSKLRCIKTGLMHDLLTGKVSVEPLLTKEELSR